MTTPQRPLPLVLIVIYFGVFGILGSLGGACALIAGSTMDTMMEAAHQAGNAQGVPMEEMPRFGAWLTLASLIGVVAAVLQVAAAYGLWSFQRWGRPLGLYLAAFAIVWGLLWMLVLGNVAGSMGFFWLIVGLAINGAIVWYLRKPEIVRLYETAPA